MSNLKYKNKYLKYKNKYLHLQSQIGGSPPSNIAGDVHSTNVNETKLLDLPEDLQKNILTLVENVPIFDKTIGSILREQILKSLKRKLRLDDSTVIDNMFISVPIYVYHPEYLEKKEILKLAKIFIDNINKPKMINRIEYKKILPGSLQESSNLDRIGYNELIPLSFNLENLKNFLLSYTNISEPLELIFEKDFYVDDKQLDFELFFIFICILIKYNQLKLKSQQIPLTIIKIELFSIDLSLFRKSFNEIIFGLKQNIIKKLSLHSNNIDEEQAIQLATAITNTKLIELCFYSMIINNKVCEALAAALKTNTTLTTFILNYNSIKDKTVGVLINALTKNKTLQIFNLSGNKIGFNGANELAKVLKHTIITELTLGDTSIGDTGAIVLAKVLKHTKIKIINLFKNFIGYSGATALATALSNSKLEILILKENNINNTGASALAKALKTNTRLTILDLRNNMLDGIGATALSKALATNTTLRKLDLNIVIRSPTLAATLATIQKKLESNKKII